MNLDGQLQSQVQGQFLDLHGERYYQISNVDQMAPFFISLVSSSDHWLFISSSGSLSAGRIRPENALFPYKSVDYIHESAENTGSKSIFRVQCEDKVALWEPFNIHHNGLFDVQRNLYKNTLGDKLIFEEINNSLKLKFQYSWNTSEKFGFIRRSSLTDLSGQSRQIEVLDGIQNILPSGAPFGALQTRSALVDAYKWNERVAGSSLALYTMYAKLSDRAEPAESLLATTVFSLDNDPCQILLSSTQINMFRNNGTVEDENLTKGIRGSYLINKTITLEAQQTKDWLIVADIDKNHADILTLEAELNSAPNLSLDVERSIEANQQELVNLMSGADAWQMTEQENTCVHHYANVLFNNMRGGVFENGYILDKKDVILTLTNANQTVASKHASLLAELPVKFSHDELIKKANATGDQQFIRLAYEYLPLTFGRRHGDPSRPWNHYEIKLKNEKGERLLSYQGNWRDIFQNWEAIALSYPEFISSFIAKFVNASTMDGYNPYRITKDGVDWELLEPDDPWSNIGYWGDHQIIYLLKFLELADKFDQRRLLSLLDSDIFSYANVPYELCGVKALFENPKDTVSFNHELQSLIEQRVKQIGSDGRLILTPNNEVYSVNLMEKILVPLLAKLSNFVVDGGIWLNTQRPEWNDANNAIVGNGLSMVTLYYMRRYVAFLQKLIKNAPAHFLISQEVFEWMSAITRALAVAAKEIKQGTVTKQTRKAILTSLASAAESYRSKVYRINGFSGKTKVETAEIEALITTSLKVIESTCNNNLRKDGLYNSYNILNYSGESICIEHLYPMLEGQVAALSSGMLTPKQAVKLLDSLFNSDMYRADQNSFMLYPDRELPMFMQKNTIEAEQVKQSPLLCQLIENNDLRVISKDNLGRYHFNAEFENAIFLKAALEQVKRDYPEAEQDDLEYIADLYEQVFNHRAFTGRSGTMFGYEGLGCIYWHMVSKLLLAVQENYLVSYSQDPSSPETTELGTYYYRVREGIGFNKTPLNYGAFPTDPYSHTPKHSGAQQPGMTGQVKEEVLTRFGELGVFIDEGEIKISPSLLKQDEFLSSQHIFTYINTKGERQSNIIKQNELAFTYCQTPFIYELIENRPPEIEITLSNGDKQSLAGSDIPKEVGELIFHRAGEVEKVRVKIPKSILLKE